MATVEDLLHPSQYYDAVRTATASTTSRLTIWVETALLSSHQLNAITQWTPLQSFLGKLYGESSRVAQGLGRVLFEVEVVLEGAERGRCPGMKRWEGRSEAWDIVWRLDGGVSASARLSSACSASQADDGVRRLEETRPTPRCHFLPCLSSRTRFHGHQEPHRGASVCTLTRARRSLTRQWC